MNITHKQAKAAEEKATGDRFCTTCQRYRKIAEGGGWKYTGKFKENKRWMCAECYERKRDLGGKR